MFQDYVSGLKGPVAIIGAGGFIGANLMFSLCRYRSDVYAVSHQLAVPTRLESVDPARIITCDIRQRAQVDDMFSMYHFRTVFFLAAYGGYPHQKDIETVFQTNVTGLANILEVSVKNGVKAFVSAGSSSEYGINCRSPKENAELKPNSHYAVSKIAAANLIKYYAASFGLPAVHLRYYSAYGPWEDRDRLIPKLIMSGVQKKYPPLVDPDISRDFIYIDDLVEATVLAAGGGVKKIPGGCLNIGTGEKTTIREIAGISREIFSIEDTASFESMENRDWDLKEWFGDPSLAKEVLDWSAGTDVKKGLMLTAEWYLDNPGYWNESASARDDRKKLSAIIACYRDEQAIPIMHERLTKVLRSLDVDYEIIFVNDCSPDGTRGVLEKLVAKDQHVIAVEHSRNFGSQSAFLSGCEIANGDGIILLDGDLQDPPEIITEFYKKWQEGYDVVYGKRVKREVGWFLGLCYKVFYRIFRIASYVPVPVDAGDFSLMDRKVVRELLRLPETDQFIRGLRAWVGFRQTGVEYFRPERMFGESTNNWVKNFWWARKAIFSFSFMPLEFLTYLGLGLTGLSFLLFGIQIVLKLLMPDIPHGITTIILLLLFYGGMQFLSASILGEYLRKIFEETKKRPKYIRRAVYYAGRCMVLPEDLESFMEERKRHINRI